MKHILVPTDFSRRSVLAMERAFDLASSNGAKMTLLHVVDEDQPAAMISAQEREAKSQFAAMSDRRPDPAKLVRVGEPFLAIPECAEEIGADLIVMGAPRRAPLRNNFIGTTAERALRTSRVPTLVIRKGAYGRYAKPVAALDLVDQDLFPWTKASGLGVADEKDAKIVFAYEAGSLHALRKANRDVKGFEKFLGEERDKVLPSVAAAMKKIGLRPDQAVLQSIYYSPAETILDVARRHGADLIIIGSQRKSAIERYMLGSVSADILRAAEIDVLVVPPV